MNKIKTTIVDYGDGIYAIDQQMVRAFVIVGIDKALLLDTGAIRIDIWSYIKEITSLPIEVVLTHRDGDHIGNLQDFEEAYIQDADMEGVLSHKECKNVKLHSMVEGDVIDIGNRKLKVIHIPGHTPGSCALLDEENKILFSGDTISYGPIFMFGDRRNMEQFLESLQRLKMMKENGEFQTVYCSHNTCPVPLDAIDELIACVKGIQNGAIEGHQVTLPGQTEPGPALCKFGNCGILIEA